MFSGAGPWSLVRGGGGGLGKRLTGGGATDCGPSFVTPMPASHALLSGSIVPWLACWCLALKCVSLGPARCVTQSGLAGGWGGWPWARERRRRYCGVDLSGDVQVSPGAPLHVRTPGHGLKGVNCGFVPSDAMQTHVSCRAAVCGRPPIKRWCKVLRGWCGACDCGISCTGVAASTAYPGFRLS